MCSLLCLYIRTRIWQKDGRSCFRGRMCRKILSFQNQSQRLTLSFRICSLPQLPHHVPEAQLEMTGKGIMTPLKPLARLYTPLYLTVRQDGLPSSYPSGTQFDPGNAPPQAGQFPLRQVPAGVDGQGQPRGFSMCILPFQLWTYTNGKTTCLLIKTIPKGWEVYLRPSLLLMTPIGRTFRPLWTHSSPQRSRGRYWTELIRGRRDSMSHNLTIQSGLQRQRPHLELTQAGIPMTPEIGQG